MTKQKGQIEFFTAKKIQLHNETELLSIVAAIFLKTQDKEWLFVLKILDGITNK